MGGPRKEEKMKVKKIYQKKFTTVDNTVLNDVELSWKAKGLFVYLWSQADGWDFYESEVVNHSTDGIAGLKTGLKELEARGYLRRERKRDKKGLLRENEWVLSEQPMLENPMLDNPTLENPTLDKPTLDYPTLENRTLTITNNNNTNNNNTKETITNYNNNNNNKESAVDDEEQKQIDFAEVQTAYQLNLRPRNGIPSAINVELGKYTQELGHKLVIYAIERAVAQIANPSWGYIKAILNSWKKAKVISVDDVKKLDESYQQRKEQQQQNRFKNGRRVVQKESLPDWAQPDYQERDTPDDPAKSKQIAEMMAKINARRKEVLWDDETS